jgi:hypothetical protein
MAERFCVNLDPNLRDGVAREARASNRTVPKQIDWILARWLAQRAIAQSAAAINKQPAQVDRLTASLARMNGE